jgi:hypothetical protein
MAGSCTKHSHAAFGREAATINQAELLVFAISCRMLWHSFIPSRASYENIYSFAQAVNSAKEMYNIGGIRHLEEVCELTARTITFGCRSQRAVM